MECLSSLGGELMSISTSILGPHIGYLFRYKKRVKDLSKKIENLSVRKDDIEEKVNAATRNGDRISKAVTKWLTDANKILVDQRIVDIESVEIDSCFKGWCCARYSLGKKASKMIGEVTELLNTEQNFGPVATPVPTQDLGMLSTKGFEAFESTQIAMDKVKKALNNDQCSIIGVHGMGGIGKTTLMKKIGSLLKAEYNVVVLVAVSQNQDVRKIQNEIAGELQLTLGQEGDDSRAKRLVARLKQENKVLIILDDIWKRLELDKVGIPWGDDHPGCKIVLTTRKEDVCTTMGTHTNVQLACLSDHDAWQLFKTNAGKEVDDPSLIGLAKKVAKECKGLPVALVTLGRAMHGKKDQNMWENVLQQLMESDIRHIEGMDEAVFRAIKLSYDYLDDEFKLFLLFCCLYPEDHKISMDGLLRYMIGEGIIKESNISRSRKKLDIAVNQLTSSHLLQKEDKPGLVTVHDVIRDVAIIIAKSEEHGFIVMAGKELDPWPEKETLRKCKRLSLMGNDLSELPDRPDCPNLLTLTLSGCASLKDIPDSFFEQMPSLVNLDISYTPISSLPSSLSDLRKLRTICLDGCFSLEDASLIGNLTTLKVISLNKTSIKILPSSEIANFPDRMLLSREN
ncbi:hypothetical protein ACHQM5_017865 [Ranunculus cassubicifolius]